MSERYIMKKNEIKNVIESSLKLLKEYVDFLSKHIEQFYRFTEKNLIESKFILSPI